MNSTKKISLIVIVCSIVTSLSIAFTGCTSTKITPLGGATFNGKIDIREKEYSGMISFTISEDSTSIISVEITLVNLQSGFMPKRTEGNFPITEGEIVASVSGIGEINGHFTSPYKAIGTINLITPELGTLNWSARTTVEKYGLLKVLKFWQLFISFILSFIVTSGYILFKFNKNKIKVGEYGKVIIWKIPLSIFFIILGILWLDIIIALVLFIGVYVGLLALFLPYYLLKLGFLLLRDGLIGRRASIFE